MSPAYFFARGCILQFGVKEEGVGVKSESPSNANKTPAVGVLLS